MLFVCRRNDATSQMAAAIFNRDTGDRANASSAGPAPAHDLEEKAVHALQEIDIELLEAFPKPITAEVELAADVIITLDSHDDIPVVDGKHYEAWRLPDLHEQGLEGYRQLRQQLESRIVDLVDRVVPAAPPPTHVAFDADLEELNRLLAGMGNDVVALVRRLGAAVDEPSGGDFDAIVAADAPIDDADALINQRVLELIARRQPVAVDLRKILAAGSTALHLETDRGWYRRRGHPGRPRPAHQRRRRGQPPLAHGRHRCRHDRNGSRHTDPAQRNRHRSHRRTGTGPRRAPPPDLRRPRRRPRQRKRTERP